MDPCQADAANAYAGGRGCAGGGEESWGRALLRRGWALSRKVAIAGVAATAAPVVAPQIIILSITWIALSVPFAACLASVDAANRLMSALLPPVAPPRRPCYSTHDDLGCEESSEQELVDAWVTPHGQEALAYGCWSKTEEDAVAEQDDRFASLPRSSEQRREPRISEELVPLLASNNEGASSAEGEHASPKSGLELLVPSVDKNKESDTAMEVDSEYITMEAPSPTVSLPEVPVVSREEDNLVGRMEEDASVLVKESVPELPVSDNDNKTEDGKSTITLTVDNESSKEMLLPGLHATESSDMALPSFGSDDVMVQSYVEGDISVGKALQGYRVSDTRDKTEQHKTRESVSPNEVSISQSKGVDDNMVVSKIEDDIIVEMAPKEEIRDTKPITWEEIGAKSLHQMPRELQAMTESAHVHDTFGSNIRGGTMKHTDNKCVEGVGYYAEEDMPNIVAVDDDNDLISSTSRTDVLGISMTTIGSKPHADKSNQTTCVAEDKCVKRESKTMDTDVATKDIAPKDDQSTRENQVALEMVLEQAASNIDPITGEVVEKQMDIGNKESETLSVSDLVAHELQVVTGAGMIDDEMEHIVKDIGDINVVDVEHQSGKGASSVVTVTSVLTMDDGEDRISSRSTPDASAISDEMTSVKGRPDLGHYDQTTGVEYKLMGRVFETKELVEDKDIYTEEQLREQLNTLRTITGYRGVPSLTLEGEVADLYMFVGVEPPHSSWGASGLMELNTKLRFLKSIIGVE